jgi:hypothetical protein
MQLASYLEKENLSLRDLVEPRLAQDFGGQAQIVVHPIPANAVCDEENWEGVETTLCKTKKAPRMEVL